MKRHSNETTENMQRVKENARNLPLTSMALAGLIGVGAGALLTSFISRQRFE